VQLYRRFWKNKTNETPWAWSKRVGFWRWWRENYPLRDSVQEKFILRSCYFWSRCYLLARFVLSVRGYIYA
jgi:hypothetical protein